MLKASLYLKVIDRTGVAEASREDQAEADCQIARRIIAEMEQVVSEEWSDYPLAGLLNPRTNESKRPSEINWGALWIAFAASIFAMLLIYRWLSR